METISRLKFFPIMMFAVIMGISGTAIIAQKMVHLGSPAIIGDILAYVDAALFAVIFFTYLLKIVRYPQAVKKEFSHPVRINFFAAVSISFLLVSIVFFDINRGFSEGLWIVGTAVQTFLTFYTISFWINHNLEIKHSNPAWFIPIVGNVLVPVVGVSFSSLDFMIYYLSVGIFFWIVLTAILINRIIFHHQLAQKFLPTLFIFIAPPAVAGIAYIKMFGYDPFAQVLYSLGLFFTFLLFFMFKNFLKLKFFISWWAFTFPLAAITILSVLIYSKTHQVIYSYFAYGLASLTTLVVAIVAIRTIEHMIKKEICVEEH